MGTLTIGEILSYANDLTIVAVLVVIIYGGHKRWWVFGWQYTESERRSNEWRELALNGTRAARQAVDLASKNRPRLVGSEEYDASP